MLSTEAQSGHSVLFRHDPLPATAIDSVNLTRRFHALRNLLAAHAELWRPAPFHVPRPAWCKTLPRLHDELLGLNETEVERLGGDNRALIALVSRHLPMLAELSALIALPPADASGPVPPERLLAHIPGRKQAQIRAFVAVIGTPQQQLLEWCAGKGHLGRLLAHRHAVPVTSLEIDAYLIAAGIGLADRADIEQRFLHADALDPAAAAYLDGHHAVALHACGDLHLALLRGAADRRTSALDLAPCCYYRIASPRYRPLNADAGLDLTREELHLAVTETVTAGARARRLRDADAMRKLAFIEWRHELGIPREQPFKPIATGWLSLPFADWLALLCEREGMAPPPTCDHKRLQEAGRRRLAEVWRLDLLRLAFRRPLEVWLALDRAVFLERAGYAVTLSEFCERTLTPRNLLISARRTTI